MTILPSVNVADVYSEEVMIVDKSTATPEECRRPADNRRSSRPPSGFRKLCRRPLKKR